MWQHITKEPDRAPPPIDVAAGLEEGGAPDTTPITTRSECAVSNTTEYSYPVVYVEYLRWLIAE